MKTIKQIKDKIEEIEKTLEEATTTGYSEDIKDFSKYRKYNTQINTLAWVLDETRKTLGGKDE